jgi:hypothetical protein
MRRALAVVVLVGGTLVAALRAEKVPLSSEELRELATHVVVGHVQQVFTRSEKQGPWQYTRYLAELRVTKIEKGQGPAPEEMLYVRYWQRDWKGQGQPPPGTIGHRGLPMPGQDLRIYLARKAYDGFGENQDGGYNVIGANGFEPLPGTK